MAVRNVRRAARHELEALEKDGDISQRRARPGREGAREAHPRVRGRDRPHAAAQGAGAARGLSRAAKGSRGPTADVRRGGRRSSVRQTPRAPSRRRAHHRRRGGPGRHRDRAGGGQAPRRRAAVRRRPAARRSGPRPRCASRCAEDSDPSTAVPESPRCPPATRPTPAPASRRAPPAPTSRTGPSRPPARCRASCPSRRRRAPTTTTTSTPGRLASSSPRWRDQPGDWEEPRLRRRRARGRRDDRVGALDDRPARAQRPLLLRRARARASRSRPSRRRPCAPSSRPRPPVARRRPRRRRAAATCPVARGDRARPRRRRPARGRRRPGARCSWLAGAAVVLAAAELYNGLRLAGYQPATAARPRRPPSSLVAAAYRDGEAAFPLVLAMVVVFGLLWYLLGVIRARPAPNLGGHRSSASSGSASSARSPRCC